jgi:hypothetical protein
MATHRFIVFTEARPGREAEYNDWYDNRHLPDVLAVPGFVGVQRFRLQPNTGGTSSTTRYLAIYEIETNNLTETMAELLKRANTASMPISDALNTDAIETYMADPLGERVTAPLH